jgi:predicted porin
MLITTKKDPQGQNNEEYKRIAGLAQFDNNTMYWTAGAGYQYENVYTSLTYFGSRMNDGDMLHDGALGVQYDLSPACSKSKFVPYAALHYFMTDEKGALKDQQDTDVPSNQGILLLTGVKFSF